MCMHASRARCKNEQLKMETSYKSTTSQKE